VEIGVLVKAVPRSEELRFDPASRTTRRDVGDLVLNPFDQRALRVALELRRDGDRVSVFSLGPPAARPLLRETLALGADRAFHLCDPAFAGSDAFATASALAGALRVFPVELVVAGARSSDGDTGLVGPELAAMLDLPVVTHARSVRRGEGGGPWEVVHATDSGRASSQVRLPFVLTVGEKIAKPLHVETAALDRQSEVALRTLGPAAIGLSPAELGALASPTVVESVRSVAPTRAGVVFASGTVADRATRAVAALAPRLARGPGAPPPLPWAPAYDPRREIAVLVTDETGEVVPVALGALAHLARSLPTYTLTAVAYGRPPSPADVGGLAASGARRLRLLDPAGAAFDSADVAAGLAAFVRSQPKLAALVVGATPFGREVAGQLAAGLRLGVIADAVDVAADPADRLVWTKPSFGGGTLATIVARSAPAVATVPYAIAPAADRSAAREALVGVPFPLPAPRARVVRTARVDEPLEGPDPVGAEVVVAVGAGVGGPEAIARLRPALERWGASLVGTRKVVDAGWLPPRAQVGLTGLLLAPRLAVLLGVRGAPNHTIGWRRAGSVLAVNVDPEATVFAQADVGIVGAVEEVVDALVAPLALALGRSPRA
jgi:electron transfer flavoprotein alpha subunit